MARTSSKAAIRSARGLDRALSGLLAVALLLGAAQAGRSFLYCLAMQEVMSGPCCPGDSARAGGDHSTIAKVARECCELRSAKVLAPCTPSTRPALITAAPIALPAAPLPVVFAIESRAAAEHPDGMRTGPPGRARARLMVFLI